MTAAAISEPISPLFEHSGANPKHTALADGERTPLAPSLPNWPVLPSAALFGLAGDIVKTIGPHTEADPMAILIQALAAAGNIVGPGLHSTVGATRHALNLFPVLVGEMIPAL